MKEFTSQTGGRYTYVDDILNLQDLALAITSLMDGCDNFIISGCEVSGSSISAGYVYINGKVRYCAGTSSVGAFPAYIYENNSVDKVSYVDSGDKVGRNNYGCAVGSSVPATVDALTGAVPQSIKVESDGTALRIKDAFFGKYALLLDGSYASQAVAKNVSFEGNVAVSGALTSSSNLNVESGASKATVKYDGDSLVLQSTVSGKTHQLRIGSNGEFRFYSGADELCRINSTNMYVSRPILTNRLSAGSVYVADDGVYNGTTDSNDGRLAINLCGYDGDTAYYRDTVIGDGKGNVMLEVDGSDAKTQLHSRLVVSQASVAGGPSMFQLKTPTQTYTNAGLLMNMQWVDKNDHAVARLGYAGANDNRFSIYNGIGDIYITNDTYITGALYLNGKSVEPLLVVPKDTGWLDVVKSIDYTNNTECYVRARQVGNVVSIQGRLKALSGSFNLPAAIDAPTQDISVQYYKPYYDSSTRKTITINNCYTIVAGSRQITVEQRGQYMTNTTIIPILITYLV